MSINGQRDKHNVAYTYNGILFSHEKRLRKSEIKGELLWWCPRSYLKSELRMALKSQQCGGLRWPDSAEWIQERSGK